MSTRGRIGMEMPDGKIKSIYVHHDSYVEGVGATLKNHYTDPAKIEELLELGDLSSLGEFYDKELAKKDWENQPLTDEEKSRLRHATVPYKDRGEDCPARVDDNLYEFISKLGCCGEEYTYLFREDYTGVYRWEMCESPYFKEF